MRETRLELSMRGMRTVARLGSPSIIVGLLAMLFLGACDETFEPLAPGAVPFSVWGFLDASADTQWIRVGAVRPLLITEPEPSEAVVTLEHLGTGAIIELRDSIFRFTHHTDPAIGSDGSYRNNFWTTEPILPGSTYRFTARREGVPAAETTIQVPADYAVEVWIGAAPDAGGDFLRLEGVRHVPFATQTVRFRDGCGWTSVATDLAPPRRPDDGVHMVPLHGRVAPREGCDAADAVVADREVWVAGSEDPWVERAGDSRFGLAPEESPYITNAMGFLGAILTKVVPYEFCEFVGPPPIPTHCRLVYDAETATIHGTVSESRCGAGPIDSASVRLREIDGEPVAHRRVRAILSDSTGQYRISGLEGNVRYAVEVRGTTIPDEFFGPIDEHATHTDTIHLDPGSQTRYDVGLDQINPCGLAP